MIQTLKMTFITNYAYFQLQVINQNMFLEDSVVRLEIFEKLYIIFSNSDHWYLFIFSLKFGNNPLC